MLLGYYLTTSKSIVYVNFLPLAERRLSSLQLFGDSAQHRRYEGSRQACAPNGVIPSATDIELKPLCPKE